MVRLPGFTRPTGFLFLALVILGACSEQQRASRSTLAELKKGSHFTESECVWPDTSVWVVVDGEGECIRYFGSGLEEHNELVLLEFSGDVIGRWRYSGEKLLATNYALDSQPAALKQRAEDMAGKHGLPFIFFARPGTYGSTGNHAQRRRPREIAVVSAAVDALKRKHTIEKFAFAGFSGGGHVIASLLPTRQDIDCATLASAQVRVFLRAGMLDFKTDTTGFRDSVDPATLIKDIPSSPTRRLFIVSDVDDKVVPYYTQYIYYHQVRRAGHDITLVLAEAADDPRHHDLQDLGVEIAAWCGNGLSDEDITRRVAEDPALSIERH